MPANAARFLGSWLRGAPLTLVLIATVWILASASRSVVHGPSHRLAPWVGLGIGPLEHGRVWVLVTSGLWATGLGGYVAATLLAAVVAAPLERRMGSGRFAVAAVTTQVLGGLLAVAVALVARMLDAGWGFRLHLGLAFGPSTWVIGVLMVASANMGTLWRRRVRTAVLTLTVTLALFGGGLEDVLRVAAAVVGLCLGGYVVGRSRRGERVAGTRREGRVLVAIVVAASTLGPVLAALSPDAVGPLAVLRDLVRGAPWSPAEVRALCSDDPGAADCRRGLLELRLGGVGPTLLSIMPSVFVLVLADGLRRGRRVAWVGVTLAQIALLALSLGNYLVRYVTATDRTTLFYGLDDPSFYRTIAPFLAPAAVLVMLLATRRFFDVAAPPGTVRLASTRISGVFVTLGVLYVAGAFAVRDGFDRPPSFADLVAGYPERLVPPVCLQWLDPAVLPVSAPATLLYEWTGVVFWIAACAVAVAAFRRPATARGTDTARAQAILRASGGSPLSWMTTWRGNSYWFGPDGHSYVAYRVVGGVALTTGDPVGPPDRLAPSVVLFAEFAASNGWVPCFYSVTGQVRAVTESLGWGAVQVAEETVLDLGSIAFTGKKFQDVRTATNKARKAAITAEWIGFPTAPIGVKDQIVAISEEWVADKGMPEMGFTLGGLDEIDDPEVRCLVAVDADRTVHGVTSWLPVYRDGVVVGWTLDFMRRRAGGFRPTTEFLIASAALMLEVEGYEFVSLSGAPLAKVDVPARDADERELAETGTLSQVMEGVLDLLGRTLEPVYGFRSLLAFKAKFDPRYEPMHMAFPDPAALPSIGNAVGRAYLPNVSVGESVRLVRTLAGRRRAR
ncbi:DUF2156 domain-containing protein [Rhodococcus sp. HNM0569]|uniref:bifunctional lysylphosphatidylglycerol flippase/synthetase MprF n=1 Tax=Rhodococcus sp. HNM0569 TaxID=2716340 RepID=UPI003211DBB7